MAGHEIKVTFGGGLKVNAEYKGFVIQTDQPVHEGGEGSMPSPFDLFLASLATCAGYYALVFCKERGIATDDLAVSMHTERGEASKMIDRVIVTVVPPTGFPPKYKAALVKAVDHCTVKAHIFRPPQFEIVIAERS